MCKMSHLQSMSASVAGIAQEEERNLAKVEVAGSNPAFRSSPNGVREVACS